MDIINQIIGIGSVLFSYGLPFLFVLTLIVFIHELGHFLVARWYGVSVEVFSIGFGKEIFGFNDQKGTRWKFCWIPLGGYVKFLDDGNVASAPDVEHLKQMSAEKKKGSFHLKPLSARMAIVAAGPIANFLLAIVIFTGFFTFYGERKTLARADFIVTGSAAEAAGFKVGDVILSVDGKAVNSFSDMQQLVRINAEKELHFIVKREGSNLQILATPERKETTDRFGNKFQIGLIGIRREAKTDEWLVEHYSPLEALGRATEKTFFVISHTLSYVYDIILGKQSADQLGGPITIAKITGQAASVSIAVLLNIAAVLSISIGLINLFPIPLLDGGHLLYYIIEAVRGRPLSDKAQEIGFRIGFAFVVMLMVFVTWNDILRLGVV